MRTASVTVRRAAVGRRSSRHMLRWPIRRRRVEVRVPTTSVAPELFDTGQTSLAGQGLVGDFVIELTDPTPLQRPVPGMDQGGTGPRFRYMQLTLTGIGRVGPAHQQGNGSVTAASRGTAIRANRAIVQVGPLPY